MTVPTDRGLQAERTALAWWRTAVGAMANGLLLLHVALVADRLPVTILALISAVALTVVAAIALRRNRILHARHHGWVDGRLPIGIVACVVAAVAGAALVVGAVFYE
ncbi:DUF202 domain-containing protein [Nocardia pseudobrasiliensis]|uniref:DUF202 domain-containing protein n=1 Tax=Nocardia pseudobrasiliensis TaxID=45979 RepID=UPI00082DE551|nr:DUF202 domain-containing protein [Nocardia pseudobrasiliensis]